MMGKRERAAEQRPVIWRLAALAACFLTGVVLGQVFSRQVPAQTADELSDYLTRFFSLTGDENLSLRTLASSLTLYFRYPVLAFLLGFASVGVILLPALTAAFGFFLSFSVCCFTAAFGGSGVLLALAVFGIRCLVTLPCYFLLAVPSLRNAAALAAISFGSGRRTAPAVYGKPYYLRFGLAVLVLLCGVFLELYLSPYFLHLVLAQIFG